MKTLLLFLLLSFNLLAQTNILSTDKDLPDSNVIQIEYKESNIPSILSCPAAVILSTGYPPWTNYWPGWMININNINGTNPIEIKCFEARLNTGTTGFEIYTKMGTFVGFQTTPGAWTLVGSVASITGISTVAPTPIPIPVNVVIPAGTTQAFYLTRTANSSQPVSRRMLYISGTGTAGTTVYSSDANIQITEANYIDYPYVLMVGVRRPSIDVYYDILSPLPIELLSFNCNSKEDRIELNWSTASETNNDYFILERSYNGVNFERISIIEGMGTTSIQHDYLYTDLYPYEGVTYYRLSQVDFDGRREYFNIISCSYSYKGVVAPMNIYDLSGRLVFSKNIDISNYRNEINNANISNGIYTIQIIQNNRIFLIQKYIKLQN